MTAKIQEYETMQREEKRYKLYIDTAISRRREGSQEEGRVPNIM
jgi:hypothetical protein